MTSTPDTLRRVTKKLDHAKFFRSHLVSAVIRKVQFEVEAFMGASIGAVQSASFTLEREISEFATVRQQWNKALTPNEREFVNRMMDERGADVHHGRTTLHKNLSIAPGIPAVEHTRPA
jgi:hypothetical protein